MTHAHRYLGFLPFKQLPKRDRGSPLMPYNIHSMAKVCGTYARALAILSAMATALVCGCGGPRGYVDLNYTPVISGVTPSSGYVSGNDTLTVIGANFFSGVTSVTVGGSACTNASVSSSTTLTCLTPAYRTTGPVDVIVTNIDPEEGETRTSTKSGAFTYTAFMPVFGSVSPNSGSMLGGTSIVITGSNFDSRTSVTVGGNACQSVSHMSSTQITCTTPSHVVAEAVSIVLTNSNAISGELYTATELNSFTYTVAVPNVTGISPYMGLVSGGTDVTITGTSFVTGATVSIGGIDCGSLNVATSTTITCTTGDHLTAGVGDVVVTNPGGGSDTLTSGFAYQQYTGSFIDSGAATSAINVNYDFATTGNKDAGTPTLVVFDSKLYAVWSETNGSDYQIRVKEYNGDDLAPSWSLVDVAVQDDLNGINHDNAETATKPHAAVFENELYVAWQEYAPGGGTEQIRVAHYNSAHAGVKWIFSDGDGNTGINLDPTHSANDVKLVVHDSKLYAIWRETNGAGFWQIRVSEYQGAGVWSLAALKSDDLVSGINVSSAQDGATPHAVSFDSRLYVTWKEKPVGKSYNLIRVKMFNPTAIPSRWDLVDGGEPGLNINGVSPQDADNPYLVVHNSSLYGVWRERIQGQTYYNIKMAKYEGDTVWDKSVSATNINKDSTKTTGSPRAISANGFLYLTWTESNGTANNTRVAAYNSGMATPWNFIDGNGTSGINKNTGKNSYLPDVVQLGSKLYFGWSELYYDTIAGNVGQIRVRTSQ